MAAFLGFSYLNHFVPPKFLYLGPCLGFLRAGICQDQESADDGHVLQEVDHLLLLLLRRNSPEMMEHKRDWYQPKRNHQRRVLCLIAGQYQQAAADLDEKRDD